MSKLSEYLSDRHERVERHIRYRVAQLERVYRVQDGLSKPESQKWDGKVDSLRADLFGLRGQLIEVEQLQRDLPLVE